MNTEKILNFLKIQTHYFCAYEATLNDGKTTKGSCIATDKRYFWETSDPNITHRYVADYIKEKFNTENINFTQFHKL
ncbi:hypothetical protein IY804_03270 [Campylobacter volucris]|uniref:hypothetical protein n=1 Tax=Campylobacter volucris TaxID=1031542 RepID=UPI00189E4C04|nr:hypothetical protein [Campylobacter volucris]MBF7047099.1 hypothetical protein [Campylobacter volucris]